LRCRARCVRSVRGGVACPSGLALVACREFAERGGDLALPLVAGGQPGPAPEIVAPQSCASRTDEDEPILAWLSEGPLRHHNVRKAR
jgi:hypothetical protein